MLAATILYVSNDEQNYVRTFEVKNKNNLHGCTVDWNWIVAYRMCKNTCQNFVEIVHSNKIYSIRADVEIFMKVHKKGIFLHLAIIFFGKIHYESSNTSPASAYV